MNFNTKNMQSNFTTPEQSKRLLELGVPEDSADLFYRGISDVNGVFNNVGHRTPYIPEDGISVSRLKSYSSFLILPCWSVGRLMEIYDVCIDRKWQYKRKCAGWNSFNTVNETGLTYVDYLIECFSFAITSGVLSFSKFSKLED